MASGTRPACLKAGSPDLTARQGSTLPRLQLDKNARIAWVRFAHGEAFRLAYWTNSGEPLLRMRGVELRRRDR
jgi:hypothetical protein